MQHNHKKRFGSSDKTRLDRFPRLRTPLSLTAHSAIARSQYSPVCFMHHERYAAEGNGGVVTPPEQ
ncbi:MAG: hypothetical protein ACHBN1_00095 [Heteroscytonema crispum UTEX LB 1556]